MPKKFDTAVSASHSDGALIGCQILRIYYNTFAACSSIEMTSLPRMCPGRLGHSWSSKKHPLHPAAINWRIVRCTLSTFPPPITTTTKPFKSLWIQFQVYITHVIKQQHDKEHENTSRKAYLMRHFGCYKNITASHLMLIKESNNLEQVHIQYSYWELLKVHGFMYSSYGTIPVMSFASTHLCLHLQARELMVLHNRFGLLFVPFLVELAGQHQAPQAR